MNIYEEALLLHEDKVGKIDVISKVKTENGHDLALLIRRELHSHAGKLQKILHC